MKGKHTIKVSNRRVHFTLELERNITVIRGDSATGKSTLVGLLRDYEELGSSSGVTLSSTKPCRVLNSVDWQLRLEKIRNSFVFIDEGNAFVSSQDFARAIHGTSNYYIIVTRESLYQLPYSVDAVLELKNTTRKTKTYNRSYPYYKSVDKTEARLNAVDRILTEDSNSGHQMFEHIAAVRGKHCDSAEGKSNIFRCLLSSGERSLVVADGAAFGAEMDKIHQLLKNHPEKIMLYLPESFEWLILKSGIIDSEEVRNILANPSDFIKAEEYMSWEQFFTALLVKLTAERDYMRYNKQHLTHFYFNEENVRKIIEAMGR